MIRWLQRGVLFQFLLGVVVVQAGPLENLSKGAFLVTGNRCESYSEDNADKLIQGATANVCINCQVSPDAKLRDLKQAFKDQTENSLFAMLAEQQVLELGCAQEFAKAIATGSAGKDSLQSIQAKLDLARVAKQNLSQASVKLATDPNVTSRTCPLDRASLDSEFPQELKNGETYRLCREIIVNRQAYLTIVSTIPLSGVADIQKYIDNYMTAKTVPSEGSFKAAFLDAAKSLNASAEKIMSTLKTKGGAGLSRRDRNTLLEDPALAESIVRKFPENSQKDIRGFLCQADARYGKGSDALDTGVMVASLAFTGGVGALSRSGMVMSKVGAAAFKTTAVASEARAAGMISFYSMRALQYAGVAAEGFAVGTTVDRACGKYILPDIKTENACTSAPSISKIPQDDCILMASLSAIGYASLIPPGTWNAARLTMASTATKITSRIEKNSSIESIQNTIWTKRASGDLAGAKKMEINLTATMADQKIVAVRGIGRGASRPYYVKFEDGTEGIWKRSSGWPSNGNSEIAAYKVDQELGSDFVAVTVPKSLNGVPGTVQARVTGLKKQSQEDFPEELSFFDFLLGNRDRHGENYLQSESGKVIAIDHGLSFSSKNQAGTNGLNIFKIKTDTLRTTIESRKALEQELAALKGKAGSSSKVAELQAGITKIRRDESKLQSEITAYTPAKKVIDKLRQTSLTRWHQVLGKELTPRQIIELWERQNVLLKNIDEAEKLLGPDLLYRQGPRSPLIREDVPGPFIFKL